LIERVEVEAQVGAVGTALIFVEDQSVGADRERDRQASQDVEGGLAGAGLVAADLRDVVPDLVGECLLSEAAFLADPLCARSRAPTSTSGRNAQQILRTTPSS
jgi:hypothetical protein